MKGKDKVFNKALIREGFRQTKWIGGLYLLLLVLNLIIEDATRAGVSTYIVGYTFYIFSALLIFVLFGFLMKRSASDVYHMLPIKRKTTYFSYGLVAFIWTAISIVVVMVGIYTVQWQTNHNIVILDYFYQILAYLSGTVLVIGVSMFSIAVSGNTMSAVIVTIALLFVPGIIFKNYVEVFYSICPHLTKGGLLGTFFNGEYNVVLRDFTSLNLSRLAGLAAGYDDATGVNVILYGATFGAYIYTTLFGVFYIIIGCVLNNRRSSEVAGKTALHKGLSLLLRLAVAMTLSISCICLIAEYLLGMESVIYYSDIILRYALIIAVWYLLEFFTTKSIKQAFKCMLQLPVLVVANILVLTFFVVSADVSSLVVPEVAEINSVNVTGDFKSDVSNIGTDGVDLYIDEPIYYPGKLISEIDLESEESKAFFSEHLAKNMETYRAGYDIAYGNVYSSMGEVNADPIEVVFNTESGEIRRNIYLSSIEKSQVYDFLIKEASDVYDFEFPLTAYEHRATSPVLKVKAYGYGFELGSSVRVAVYNSLYEELQETKAPLSDYIGQVYDREDAFVYIYKSEDDGGFYLPVSKDTPDSLELLISLTNKEINEEYFDFDEDAQFRDSRDMEVLILPKDADKIEHAEYNTGMGLEMSKYNEELKLLHDALANPSDEVSLDENILVVHYRYFDQYKGSTWTNVSDEELESILNLSGYTAGD